MARDLGGDRVVLGLGVGDGPLGAACGGAVVREQGRGEQAGDEGGAAGALPGRAGGAAGQGWCGVVQGRQGDASPFFATAYRVS